MVSALWHPHAKRVPFDDAGPMTGGGWKFVIHTTEGSTAEGALAAYRAAGVSPHFTLAVVGGRRLLYQHVPINRASTALKHTFPQQTNKANAIQVEVVGFAAKKMTDEQYHYLHLLMLWCHRHAGVPMEARHPFIGEDGYHRLSPDGWVKASGAVGHCHCPGNDHTDPGKLDRARLLKG